MEERETIEVQTEELSNAVEVLSEVCAKDAEEVTEDDIRSLRQVLGSFSQTLEIWRDTIKDEDAEEYYERMSDHLIEGMSPPDLAPEDYE